MGRLHTKGVLENLFLRTNHSVWLIGWVLPYFCEGPVKNPSIWKESFTLIVPWIRSVRGCNLEGWHVGCRQLRSWHRRTHLKSTRKDSMQKRWYFPKKMENSFFQSQMDESNFLEEIRNWEHPLWYGNTQFEEKVAEIFLENQKGLHLHHVKTHFRMLVKRQMTSGPCQETSFSAITLNPESNFTCREKNNSLFHWNTLTSPELQEQNLDVMQESRIDDDWNIDGSRDLSVSWTGFTQFTPLDEKPPDGYLWSGEGLTKRQATSTPDHL